MHLHRSLKMFSACLSVWFGSQAVDAATVLVSDFANNQVLSYDVSESGTWSSSEVFISSGTYGGVSFTNPLGLASDGANMYVATSSAILRFSTTGSYLGVVRNVSGANGLTVDASGNLYYTVTFGSASAQGLFKIADPSTTATQTTIATGLSNARGVAVGSDGRIYVAQRGAGTITAYNADGSFSGTITSGLGSVQALTWDADGGRLLFSYSVGADLTRMSIGAVTTAGTLTEIYNNSGATYFFNNALGVVSVSGSVFASSIQSNNISKINGLTSASDVVTGPDAGFMLVLGTIPEPSAAALLAGLVGGGLVMLRRNRKGDVRSE